MKTRLFMNAIAVATVTFGWGAMAHADCSFQNSGRLLKLQIQQAAREGGYTVENLKGSSSMDESDHLTQILFAFTARYPNPDSSSGEMLGYAVFDRDCAEIASFISNAGAL